MSKVKISMALLLTALLVVSVMVTGCPPEQVVDPVVEPLVPTRENTIVIMGHHEVTGLSPDHDAGSVCNSMIWSIHNALLELNHKLELEPVLAESYEVTPDGLTVTFHLRRGVLFHDGTPFTSADVKYTFEFFGDPANAAVIMGRFVSIDYIETPDDYTVILHLYEPDPTIITITARTAIVAKHHHMEVGQEIYATAPIGTGAFKLVEFRPAEFTLLEAFDDHFRGRPKVDFLRLDVVPEASVRAMALEMGEADASVWPFIVEDNLRFAADPRFTTLVTPSLAVNHFLLNNQIPQLADRRVRQAMMYAIDRQWMIEDVFAGAAVVAHTNKSPAVPWFNPYTRRYPFDPERAKALLDEAGWTVGPDGVRYRDGIRLSFTCHVISGDVVRMPQAELAQFLLGEVGIEMLITESPIGIILAGMREGTMDASLFNFTHGDTEPDPWLSLHSEGGNNFFQFRNERVDELIEMGRREMDTEKRRLIYNEIQEIVAEEVPFLFMMYWDWFISWSGRIRGLPPAEEVHGGHWVFRLMHEVWIGE